LREPGAEPIPGYRLIEPLGSGGFGEVWKCEAPGGIYKAIKFVFGNLNSLDSEGVRAEQELHALQRVKEVRHPFVLSMDRIENIQGELVIVMELADKSLHDEFVECQAAGLVGIPRDALMRYVRDAAEALDHMIQRHNLQHLDIKPRNLFLISDRVKVADFGLVKHLERTGVSGLVGGVTPLYAPPETFNNKISEHSDQYSLAIVYQELLTGQRPFNGKNARQLAMQHMNEEPDLRTLPEAERPVVARALSKDPSKRWPNCLSFVKALYQARSPVLPEAIIAETGKDGQRPKSIADTMEDILLEQLPDVGAAGGKLALPAEVEEVSQLGLTVAQPQTGALRPTLVIGLGAFGRKAILELRCRFLDRFGDLAKIPMVHFLYVDPDPETPKTAHRGAPEVALQQSEICHLPLQPVGNYRRRMIEQLSEWLPREKLYSVPRSLQTQGSRALGRLAFADNHLRLLARLKRDLQKVTHPDTIYQSVSQTGLALRDNVPRVYVLAAAGGGSSGLLVDLGYALRRLLQQLRQPDAQVLAFVFGGAPSDPATPKAEQANVYAALTELNHFCDPAVPFSAEYSAEGSRIVDQGAPYHGVYLLMLPHRSPEALRDAVAHLGSYIFHDLTTPLGLRLDRCRRAPTGTATPFRGFGTYAVWFPRGLMLRLAARQVCSRLMVEWQSGDEPTAAAEVNAACARALADPELRFEALCSRIEATTQIPGEGTPAEAITGLLARLEEQSQQTVAQDDPGNWARQALNRVREWVGSGVSIADQGSDWRQSKLSRALTQAIQALAQDWDRKLSASAFGLMEHPGRRVAAAEAALRRFHQFCHEAIAAQQSRFNQQNDRTQQAWDQLASALERCLLGPSTFSFFGGRSRRQLRVFFDHLTAFTRQRLGEEVIGAGIRFFSILQGKMEERLRELTFCRQRLRALQEAFDVPDEQAEQLAAAGAFDAPRLAGEVTPGQSPTPTAESFWESIRQSSTVRVVLPDGETDLERAAARFVAGLSGEQWVHMDHVLQDRVLGSLGGLYQACVTAGDMFRHLARPMVDQAASALGDLLPITDVAQVEVSNAEARGLDIAAHARSFYAHAAPLVCGKDEANQHGFLLIPASEAGKAFGEQAKQALPNLHLVRVPGQADLMFCREQGFLTLEDLDRILSLCRPAYEDAATVPNSSPHSRFDIIDWTPLSP
jgi:hypothetical protein